MPKIKQWGKPKQQDRSSQGDAYLPPEEALSWLERMRGKPGVEEALGVISRRDGDVRVTGGGTFTIHTADIGHHGRVSQTYEQAIRP